MAEAEPTTPPPPAVPSVAPRPSSQGSAEEDWTCADCSNVNFSWRNNCNRCAKSRPNSTNGRSGKKRKLGTEIGKAAAEKSRGLFSADDWQCNKCGNVNWARRQSCNVCNAPKFGEVEERTGFGGGYNDRGVVEYKERHDSDDEYDEFGRRKKRRRRSDSSSSRERERRRSVRRDDEDDEVAVAAVEDKKRAEVRKDDVEDEVEEEDEDDDDGDLSKYDLSDWGDSVNEKNKVKN